jgi:hypothetical protein
MVISGNTMRAGKNADGRQCFGPAFVAIVAATALIWAGPASAQVRQIQGGSVLDANPQVGSGGYNGVRPVASGINGNLIVTGNVTGGRAFQGFSPIGNPSTLQTNVGSGTLSNFVRDSVGLPGVQGGLSPYTPRPYFDLPQTAISTGAVQAQSVLPRDVTGAYRAGQGQFQTPVATLSGTRSTSLYAGQLPYAAPGWTPAGIGMFNPDIVATTPGQISPNPLQPYTVTGPAAVSEATGRPSQTGPQADLPGMPPAELPVQPGRVELPDRFGRVEPSEQTGPLDSRPEQATVAQLSGLDGQTAPPQAEPSSGLPTTGQTDSTLLVQMRQQYSEGQPGTADNAGQPQQPITQKQMQPLDMSVATASRRPSDETRLLQPGAGQDRERMQAQREQASQLVAERLRSPIRSLAGQRQTQVDRLLAQAEEQMRKGDYYRASATYSGVLTAAPDNALAWLGRANALLAAGEYIQAHVALSQGIEQFPQLLSFDFDLPALLGNKDIVDVRRAELEKMLATRSDYRMRFLLGYLEYYSGLQDIGLQTMQQAAKEAPADSIVPKAHEVLKGRGAGAVEKAG